MTPAQRTRAWREANPEASRERARKQKQRWRAANPDKVRVHNIYSRLRHRRARQSALPGYTAQIETVYEIARYLTRKTGILHTVDHHWPLKGKHSCGLHVPWNLVVITGVANDSKGNKEPDYGF